MQPEPGRVWVWVWVRGGAQCSGTSERKLSSQPGLLQGAVATTGWAPAPRSSCGCLPGWRLAAAPGACVRAAWTGHSRPSMADFSGSLVWPIVNQPRRLDTMHTTTPHTRCVITTHHPHSARPSLAAADATTAFVPASCRLSAATASSKLAMTPCFSASCRTAAASLAWASASCRLSVSSSRLPCGSSWSAAAAAAAAAMRSTLP
jgi:hypothetical protein